MLTKNSIIVCSAYIIVKSLAGTLSGDWPIGLTTVRMAGGNYKHIHYEDYRAQFNNLPQGKRR